MHVVPDREWTEKNFAKWFTKNKPEVVVSHHEEVLEWLARLKVKVPQETGFIHLNLPDTTGRMAGIYQNGHEVGAAAADFLVAMLHRNERGIPELPHTILVEGTWIDGKTLLARSNYGGSEYSKRKREEQLRPLETREMTKYQMPNTK